MSRALLIGAALLVAASGPIAAQSPVGFADGKPVRVHFPGEQPIAGTLVSSSHESFVFRPSGEAFRSSYVTSATQTAQVGYKEVDVLWVDLGRSRKHSAWRGALWGGYLGAASGAVAGPFVARSSDYTIGQASGGLSLGAGLAGAALGAVVGAIVAPEHRWKPYRFVTR